MQSVSYKDGKYIVTSRFTISKGLISIFASLGPSVFDSIDELDDFADLLENSMSSKSSYLQEEINDLYRELKESCKFPYGGHTSKIDTDADVGINCEAVVYARSESLKDFRAYIPKRYENALTLELSENFAASIDDEMGEFSEILSGMKHRIYIGKNILRTLSKSEITNSDYLENL